jgi:membrane protease subunit (stomatin/prohibitin family)
LTVGSEIVINKISRPRSQISQYYYATVQDPSILHIRENTKVNLIENKEIHTYTLTALRPGWTTVQFELKHMLDGQILEQDVRVFVVNP